MKTLPDVPWQRKGCRHSKEFRRDRQSYTDIRISNKMLVAGNWSFRVTCNEPLCLELWGLAYSFRFSGCSFFTGAFCTTRDYLCSFTWTLLTPATRGGKCLKRRNFSITENSPTAATCMQSLGSAERLQVLPPHRAGC